VARPPKIDEDAIDLAQYCLGRRWDKGKIKIVLKEKFDLSARSCERVLSRARERIVLATSQDRREHRQDAFGFYLSVIRDAGATTREKLLAQERIDKLFGLEAAAKVEVNPPPPDPDLAEIQHKILNDERANELAEELAIHLARNTGRDGRYAGPALAADAPPAPAQ
jgi:hypothetical protein